VVIYTCAGRSQGKLWWKSVAVLTCKSFVRRGYRGERLIEPPSSWFPPKVPSGSLEHVDESRLVKIMIRGSGGLVPSPYSQTLKRRGDASFLVEVAAF